MGKTTQKSRPQTRHVNVDVSCITNKERKLIMKYVKEAIGFGHIADILKITLNQLDAKLLSDLEFRAEVIKAHDLARWNKKRKQGK